MSVGNLTARRVLRDIAARDRSDQPVEPISALILFWQAWLEKHEIPKKSADEFPLFDHGLTEAQAEVVRLFSALWDAADKADLELPEEKQEPRL